MGGCRKITEKALRDWKKEESLKILLVKKASGACFSLEAGMADGVRNFDHHREHSANPAPCRDERIPVVGVDDVVEITHIDADCFVGILRMAGKALPEPEVDLLLMEKIDLNGSSVCEDKFNPTLLYMGGIGQITRELRFPRVAEESQNVSEVVEAIFAKTTDEIIAIGRVATEASEATYRNCRKAIAGKVGFWVIGPKDPLDPSRPYEDGVEIVVVFRDHYKSISIYCSPKSEFEFGGQTLAGIEFAGHPKACGSPRGMEMTEKDARRVFEVILSRRRA